MLELFIKRDNAVLEPYTSRYVRKAGGDRSVIGEYLKNILREDE